MSYSRRPMVENTEHSESSPLQSRSGSALNAGLQGYSLSHLRRGNGFENFSGKDLRYTQPKFS